MGISGGGSTYTDFERHKFASVGGWGIHQTFLLGIAAIDTSKGEIHVVFNSYASLGVRDRGLGDVSIRGLR